MTDNKLESIFEAIGLLNKDYFTKQISFEDYDKKCKELYSQLKALIKEIKNDK